MKIVLLPYGDSETRQFYRGWKTIEVDGAVWGRIEAESRGPNGMRYHFADAMNARLPDVSYWSGTEKGGRMAVLLVRKVAELINSGLLRSPDVVKDEAKKRAYDRSAYFLARQAAVDGEFRAKAQEAAGFAPGDLHLQTQRDLVDRIVEAMKWAQHQ